MKLRILNMSFLLLFLFAGMTNAQVRRNAAERASDHAQISAGKQQLKRDRQELDDFRNMLNSLESAWKKEDATEVNRIKSKLIIAMDREIRQSEARLKQDGREVKRSKSELRSESREVRYDRRDARTRDGDRGERHDLRQDRRGKRDDRRDVRDDRRDYLNQEQIVERQKEIYKTLKAYNFVIEGASLDKAIKNKALLSDFIDTMEADIRLTELELGEDKGELREDRRETRDDRRERRETR
jgi:hypothetical protein